MKRVVALVLMPEFNNQRPGHEENGTYGTNRPDGNEMDQVPGSRGCGWSDGYDWLDRALSSIGRGEDGWSLIHDSGTEPVTDAWSQGMWMV